MSLQLRNTDIRIQAERVWLDAFLSFAPTVRGLIICAMPYIAHLRDSRENHAADHLRNAGFGTLLVSMLTPYEESRDPDVRYDISLLANRLHALLTWIDQQPGLSGLPIGIQASSTVAAAAIRLSVREPDRVSAIVSRAGRTDLAGAEPLRRLLVPTLMIVPGAEKDLSSPSQQAYSHMEGPKAWHEIGLASASFIEPGTLENAATEGCLWFSRHLPTQSIPRPQNPAAENDPGR